MSIKKHKKTTSLATFPTKDVLYAKSQFQYFSQLCWQYLLFHKMIKQSLYILSAWFTYLLSCLPSFYLSWLWSYLQWRSLSNTSFNMLHKTHSGTRKHLSTHQQSSVLIFITAAHHLSVWSMIMAQWFTGNIPCKHLLKVAEWCHHNGGHDGSWLYIVQDQQYHDDRASSLCGKRN